MANPPETLEWFDLPPPPSGEVQNCFSIIENKIWVSDRSYIGRPPLSGVMVMKSFFIVLNFKLLLNTSTAAKPLMFIHCHVTIIIRYFFRRCVFRDLLFFLSLRICFSLLPLFEPPFPNRTGSHHSMWGISGRG